MPVFTNDGHIFNATFLFATGKVWIDISVSASALSKVSDVCHTHTALGFPSFPPRPCLIFGFLAETVLEHTSQLEWFFLPESKPCFLHQLIWVDGWCPRAEISSKAKSMPHLRTQCTPMTTNTHCGVPPSHWPPWMWSQFRSSCSFLAPPSAVTWTNEWTLNRGNWTCSYQFPQLQPNPTLLSPPDPLYLIIMTTHQGISVLYG